MTHVAWTPDAARRWTTDATSRMIHVASDIGEAEFDDASTLPGWSRRHVLAHVAANADALLNLVRWASTGRETPMYASPAARAEGIERGVALPTTALLSWLEKSAAELDRASADLTPEQWENPVVTAQGRVVAAVETRWMRAREVSVHLVDLNAGLTFDDLPPDFCRALNSEILAKRGLGSLPDEVAGAPLAEVTAWLAGRPHGIPGAPGLEPWL